MVIPAWLAAREAVRRAGGITAVHAAHRAAAAGGGGRPLKGSRQDGISRVCSRREAERMEVLMAFVIGALFSAGTYLVMSRRLLRVVLGSALLTHGTHLLLMTMGGLKRGGPPVLAGSGPAAYVDPLPQALILTSIVIGFGVTAFLLVLAYRIFQERGTDDLDELRGIHYD